MGLKDKSISAHALGTQGPTSEHGSGRFGPALTGEALEGGGAEVDLIALRVLPDQGVAARADRDGGSPGLSD